MAAYEYQALNARGGTIKGVVNGDNVRNVRAELRAQGLVPLEVAMVSHEASSVAQGGSRSARRTKIKNNDLSILTRQMATLLNSGMTVEETLSAMIEQSEGQKAKAVMSDVKDLVSEGYALSDAIALYPRSFPEIYHATIYAGEQSGTLGDVLERLADYLESRNQVQQRVSVALIYPIFLTIVCIAIIAGSKRLTIIEILVSVSVSVAVAALFWSQFLSPLLSLPYPTCALAYRCFHHWRPFVL